MRKGLAMNMTKSPGDTVTHDQIHRLLDFGTSTVYEGSGIDCWLEPLIRPMWKGARVAGPAYTVRAEQGDNLSIQVAVRKAEEGSVLVVDAQGGEYGYWGEMLTEIARIRNLTGLVINGTVRDIDEIENLEFPVFATGIAMRHAGKKHSGVIGETIKISGRTVRTGDIIVADSDGVISVPREQIQRALDGAEARADMESKRLAIIRSGEVPPMTAEDGVY